MILTNLDLASYLNFKMSTAFDTKRHGFYQCNDIQETSKMFQQVPSPAENNVFMRRYVTFRAAAITIITTHFTTKMTDK